MKKNSFRERMLMLWQTRVERNAKNAIAVISAMVLSLLLPSCSDNNNDEPTRFNQEVTVLLDYSLMESGSMTRSGENIYSMFYESCIKNKKLAPKNYSLDFFDAKETDETKRFIKRISGTWEIPDGVRLPVGSYRVEGTSAPFLTTNPGCACDSLWLTFEEAIDVSNDTKIITLNAKYNCFLLFFDEENISRIETYYFDEVSEKRSLNSINGVYYLFVKQTQRDIFDSSSRLEIKITRKSGAVIRIDLSQMPFEKGKYYYFNDVTNTFNLEPMEQGV